MKSGSSLDAPILAWGRSLWVFHSRRIGREADIVSWPRYAADLFYDRPGPTLSVLESCRFALFATFQPRQPWPCLRLLLRLLRRLFGLPGTTGRASREAVARAGGA